MQSLEQTPTEHTLFLHLYGPLSLLFFCSGGSEKRWGLNSYWLWQLLSLYHQPFQPWEEKKKVRGEREMGVNQKMGARQRLIWVSNVHAFQWSSKANSTSPNGANSFILVIILLGFPRCKIQRKVKTEEQGEKKKKRRGKHWFLALFSCRRRLQPQPVAD